jgi:salicylate hydroxylase
MSFKIVVVGTGIAGLGAAVALTNKGHNVTVVEATTKLQPIGGIIVMQANANRVLDSLGVYESIKSICAAISLGPSTRRYQDGEFLIKKPPESHEKIYGYPYVLLLDVRWDVADT